MRVLMQLAPVPEVDLSDDELDEIYRITPAGAPDGAWLRVNMVASLDGAAHGEEGRSGDINNAVDKRVFFALRRIADCVVVGAGTARAESYRPARVPIVVVSRSGVVPESLRGAEPGKVLLATCEHAEGLAESRALLGEDNVLVLGTYSVNLVQLRSRLVARGWTQILSEGGPHLLHDLLAEGVADELCLTTVPRVISGEHPRIVHGPPIDVQLEPLLLLEEDGTLLGRWLVT
ncbi:dihydrofolate reductase family protein [Nocardioides houyundeii]|uniref:dihydrofolate reductase family protein n=1 Tax=Nocardioides houyundeii TaxID=2045452 RepID=UPI000C77270E|nr:dihydrofolate reductase family protein [Nocardioides houyundeii]